MPGVIWLMNGTVIQIVQIRWEWSIVRSCTWNRHWTSALNRLIHCWQICGWYHTENIDQRKEDTIKPNIHNTSIMMKWTLIITTDHDNLYCWNVCVWVCVVNFDVACLRIEFRWSRNAQKLWTRTDVLTLRKRVTNRNVDKELANLLFGRIQLHSIQFPSMRLEFMILTFFGEIVRILGDCEQLIANWKRIVFYWQYFAWSNNNKRMIIKVFVIVIACQLSQCIYFLSAVLNYRLRAFF